MPAALSSVLLSREANPTRDDFLEAIRKKPVKTNASIPPLGQSPPSAVTQETLALVARIENASYALSEYYERSLQLEKMLREMNEREALSVKELDEAHALIATLQTEMVSERNRSARAETTLRASASIIAARDDELTQLRSSLDTLTSAIQRSFEERTPT